MIWGAVGHWSVLQNYDLDAAVGDRLKGSFTVDRQVARGGPRHRRCCESVTPQTYLTVNDLQDAARSWGVP
ncbi:hypothetical protein GCM10009855_21180 [Gordonia cholesterolivorans]|uniref:Uncharacterized protein n=1 Tax=Gordonia cholesterolivorans TaxID=559625 RepID=A0ABN3HIA3_9ACTN